MLLSRLDDLINDHSSYRSAILLLFRGIHPMSNCIDSKTVDHLSDWKILNLSIVICVLGLKDRDEATGTSRVDSSQARIEFHDVGPCRQRKMRNRRAGVESKNR